MIAFITINSGLVPLIEGRCAQILYFRFEIIGGLHSQLLLFFFARKDMLLCTHIRIYVFRVLVHVDSSGPPGVSSRLLGSHPSSPSVQCVCVFAYTHTYTYIHSHPR